jgi:formamidopyrimidine-DNA glycosylase
MLYVCQTAVDLLADSNKFPEEWLFRHRWGKGKKDAPKELPNGEKIIHLTVGGRTSCVVPSIQKKTGPAAADVKTKCKEVASGDGLANPKATGKADGVKKPGRGKAGSTKVEEGFSDEEEPEYPKAANPKGSRKRKMAAGEEVTQINDTKALSNAVKRRTTVPEQNEVETDTKHTSRVRSKRSKVIEQEPILQASHSKGTHSDGGARRSGRVPKAKV